MILTIPCREVGSKRRRAGQERRERAQGRSAGQERRTEVQGRSAGQEHTARAQDRRAGQEGREVRYRLMSLGSTQSHPGAPGSACVRKRSNSIVQV